MSLFQQNRSNQNLSISFKVIYLHLLKTNFFLESHVIINDNLNKMIACRSFTKGAEIQLNIAPIYLQVFKIFDWFVYVSCSVVLTFESCRKICGIVCADVLNSLTTEQKCKILMLLSLMFLEKSKKQSPFFQLDIKNLNIFTNINLQSINRSKIFYNCIIYAELY